MRLDNLQTVYEMMDSFLWPEPDARQRGKRQRVLHAATQLFQQQGYRKTSMSEVAQRSGVAKGTLYLYYHSKAELLYHAIALEKRQYLQRIGPLFTPQQTAAQQLHAMIALGIVMVREMPLTTSLIQGDHELSVALLDIDSQIVAEVNQQQTDFMLTLLDTATQQRLTREQLQIRGRVLLDLIFAITTSSRPNPDDMPWPDYAVAVADMVVAGALNSADSSRPADVVSKPRIRFSN